MRFKKTVKYDKYDETYYYLDGTKILGEDRPKQNKKLRYIYGIDGIVGFLICDNNGANTNWQSIDT